MGKKENVIEFPNSVSENLDSAYKDAKENGGGFILIYRDKDSKLFCVTSSGLTVSDVVYSSELLKFRAMMGGELCVD